MHVRITDVAYHLPARVETRDELLRGLSIQGLPAPH